MDEVKKDATMTMIDGSLLKGATSFILKTDDEQSKTILEIDFNNNGLIKVAEGFKVGFYFGEKPHCPFF